MLGYFRPRPGTGSGVKMCSHTAACASRFQPKNCQTRQLDTCDLPHEISPFLSLSHPPLSDKYSPLVWLVRLTSPGWEVPRVRSGQVRSQRKTTTTTPILLNYAIVPFLPRRLRDCLRFPWRGRHHPPPPTGFSLRGTRFLECRDF